MGTSLQLLLLVLPTLPPTVLSMDIPMPMPELIPMLMLELILMLMADTPTVWLLTPTVLFVPVDEPAVVAAKADHFAAHGLPYAAGVAYAGLVAHPNGALVPAE